MKTYLIPFCLTALLLLCGTTGCRKGENAVSPAQERLYEQLDHEIRHADIYERQKTERLNVLRRQLRSTSSYPERNRILNNIIEENSAYCADSAIHYIDMALRLAKESSDPGRVMELEIMKADIYAHAGLFSDALDIIGAIRSDDLPGSLKEEYYATCSVIYQYLCETTDGAQHNEDYEQMRAMYADSLLRTAREGSFNYAVYCIPEKARRGEWEESAAELREYLDRYRPGDRHYSILSSIMAYLTGHDGPTEESKRYITMSAISDVKGVIKENMSFRSTAANVFAEGNVERANLYLKKSIVDANFYSARMRKNQSSAILPDIDNAYDSMQENLRISQRNSLIIVSLLALILAVSILIILRQSAKVRRKNELIKQANRELSQLSTQLQTTNRELEASNARLSEATRVREQYTGFFMEACSNALGSLVQYHNSMKILASQQGVSQIMARKLKSSEFIEKGVRDFYDRFDEAILNIYPDFPEKVNILLRDGEKSNVKPGEKLNTELRIVALTRIGLADNAKIADFLRCSITTVYTYRSKLRKRAVNPDSFESDIMLIGE